MNLNPTHLDETGTTRMADVSQKPLAKRIAIAQAIVKLDPATLKLPLERNLPKDCFIRLAAKAASTALPISTPPQANWPDILSGTCHAAP